MIGNVNGDGIHLLDIISKFGLLNVDPMLLFLRAKCLFALNKIKTAADDLTRAITSENFDKKAIIERKESKKDIYIQLTRKAEINRNYYSSLNAEK